MGSRLLRPSSVTFFEKEAKQTVLMTDELCNELLVFIFIKVFNEFPTTCQRFEYVR